MASPMQFGLRRFRRGCRMERLGLLATVLAAACVSGELSQEQLDEHEESLTAPPAGSKMGVIGDSMSLATHSNDMCGSGGELGSCLSSLLGAHDPAWSHASGTMSWSFPMKRGYAAGSVHNVAVDGASWSGALAQAQSLTADPAVRDVLIHLGANDVCRPSGSSYTGKLTSIGSSIDS